MAVETVTLTAELKDQMSAPLSNAVRAVDGFTKAVESGAKKQSAAVSKSTAEIDGSVSKQNRLFSGMGGPIGKATDGAARMFSGMRSKITNALDGLPEYTKKQGERAGNGFADGLKKASGLVATYFGAQMIGGFIKDAAAASDATDKFVSTMSFAGIDTSGIDAAKKSAKEYADQTVYDLPTIQSTFAQLASNGVKGYTDITKAAGNLNAVAGGNAETFKSVARTLTQSAGAGKLMTEDWNMLADAIPGASGPLQKAMLDAGAYTGNFRDAMAEGQITADEFQAAILTLGNQPVAVEAAKSTKTFEGALGNLQATINSGLMRALDAIKPAAAGAISALSDGLGKSIDWTAKAATGLRDLFVKGDFTGAFAQAFHVEEDSPVVDVLFKIRDAVVGITSGLSMGKDTRDQFAGQLEGWVKAGAETRDILEKVVKFLWDSKEPIAVVAALITTLFIPHWIALGTTAIAEAGKNRLAWLMTKVDATKAALTHSGAVMTMVGGWLLLGAQAMIQAVKIAASWLVAMGPVGWVIGIIALLVGAFVWAYNNVEWFRDGVDTAMRWIGDVTKVVVDWIVGAWNNVVTWFNSTLLPAVQAIGGFFHDAFWVIENYWNTKFLPALQALGQWFSDAFTNIGNGARDFVGMLVDGWGHLVDFWNSAIVPWLQELAAPFVAAFDWIARLAWNFATIVVALWMKLVDLWNGVLLPAIKAVGQWFSDVFSALWTNVLKPVVDGIVQGFQGVVNFFTTVFAWVYDNVIKPYIDLWVAAFRGVVDWWNITFIPAMQAFGTWVGSIMTWIYDNAIKPVVDFIVNGFGMIVDFWNLTFIPGLQALGDFVGSVMNWIYTTLIQPVIDMIVGAFRGLVDFWNGTLMPAAQAVGDWFTTTIGGAINGVKSFIDDSIKNWQTFISFVGDKLKPVIDGIATAFNTVRDAIGEVLKKIGEFANNPLGGIQDLLGIKKDGNGQGIMPAQNSGGGVYTRPSTMFAGGGVLGGYQPGRDVIPALLSPGESVLVPELTAAIGPANIMAANAAASGGRPAGAGPALTSGYSGASRGGTMTLNAPIQITVQAGADGSVDAAALQAAVEDALEKILDEHNRREY